MKLSCAGVGCLVMLSAWATFACGGGTDSSSDPEPVGRGSDACHDWQDAFCDYVADQCGSSSRATCDDQARAISCNSDAEAEACVETLRAAACDSPPAECDLRALADPAPAVAACEDLAQAACAVEARCGGRTLEECVPAAITEWSCPDAVGVTLDYEECMSLLDDYPCTEPPPDVCDRVLLR